MAAQHPACAGRMERARVAAGYTIAEVAAKLTRNPVSVRRWELGRTMCSRDVLLALSRLYRVPPQELVD